MSAESEGHPLSERAAALASAALDLAEHHLLENGSFLGMAIAESETLDLVPLDLQGDPRPGRGLLPEIGAEIGPLRECVRRERKQIQAYAIVVDAVLGSEEDDDETDAVVVEVGVAGEPVAYLIAQPYFIDDESYEATEDPGVFDTTENLLN